MQGFGTRLKEVIKKSSYSQKEVAKLINISEDSMSLYVKEKKYPDIQKVYKLCDLLKVDPNYLIIGKNSDLTEEEQQLLEFYRNCSKDSQTIIINAAKSMQQEQENRTTSSDYKIG